MMRHGNPPARISSASAPLVAPRALQPVISTSSDSVSRMCSSSSTINTHPGDDAASLFFGRHRHGKLA